MGAGEHYELLQHIWSECGTGYMLVDKNLFVLSANPAAYTLFCQTEVTIIGMQLSELLEASIDFSVILSNFAMALGGTRETFTIEGVFPKGWLCLDFTLFPVKFLGEPRLMIQFIDVTSNQREKDNLERLLNLFEEMVAVVSDNGFFTRVSNAWTAVLGWDSDELLTVPWKEYVHHNDLQKAEKFFVNSQMSDKSEAIKLRFQAADESWHWLELRAIPDRINDTLLVVARDITADELLRQQIVVSEKNYRTIFDSATDIIVVQDAVNGLLVDVNQRACQKLKCSREYLLKEGLMLFYKGKKANLFTALCKSGKPIDTSFEAEAIFGQGESFPVMVEAYLVEYNGKLAIISLLRDITEQKKFEAELQRLAVTDTLTGLENRRAFYIAGESEFERFRRYNTGFSLAMVDIDYFKKVNDTYGHDAGDLVLKEVSSLLAQSVRKLDTVYRFGGEEFIIMMPSTSADNSALVCDRIREKLSQTPVILSGGEELHCTISIGVSEAVPGDTSIDVPLKRADDALYISKESGRNRVTIG